MLSVRPISAFAVLLILSGLQAEAGDGTSETSIERWDRVICLVESRTDAAGKKSGDAGSAFLLEDNGKLVLVTAGHVAQFTTAKSRVLFRDAEGESHWIILGGLTAGTGQPWRHHAQADLAVMEIDAGQVEPARFAAFTALAIPLDHLAASTPRRTTQIEITGFPMLLGATPHVSPLVMAAEVASRELLLEAKWGHEEIVFAHPAVPNGTSGGPAFITSEDPQEARILGLYIGFQQDNHGHKLAKLVPGHVILDLVRAAGSAAGKTTNQPFQSPPDEPAAAEDSAAAALNAGS